MLPINDSEFVVVNVSIKSHVSGGGAQDTNKNGELPFIMKPMAGRLPQNAMTVDGTVGETMGMTLGLNVVKITRTADDAEYGDQYTVERIGACTPIELITQYLPTLKKGVVLMSDAGAPEVEAVLEAEGAVGA